MKMKMSAKRMDGFGLTDGEGTERMWSFLRKMGHITKEMTASHRLDLLTSSLFHFCDRKKNVLGDLFSCYEYEQCCQVTQFVSMYYFPLLCCATGKWLALRKKRIVNDFGYVLKELALLKAEYKG